MKIGSIFLILFLLHGLCRAEETADPYAQGMKLYGKGDYQKALKLFKKALKTDRKNWLIAQSAGDACVRLQKPDEAIHYYQQSLKYRPDNPALERYLADPNQKPGSPLAPPSPAVAITHSGRVLEISPTIGAVFPFQPSILSKGWQRSYQGSLYFGFQPSERWAFGIQMDVLRFPYDSSGFNALYKNSAANNNYQYKVTFSGDPDFWDTNLSLNFKFYLIPSSQPLHLYLLAGGGVFTQYRQDVTIINKDNFSNNSYNVFVPGLFEAAPSMQWALGIPMVAGHYGRVLLEYRMNYAYTQGEPTVYGGVNVGALFYL